MKYDAIIFDLDGTIWNSCASCAKAWTIALKKLGIDKKITTEQIESVTGLPFKEGILKLLPKEHAQFENLTQTINECEIEVINEEGGQFYKGVIEKIQNLAKSNRLYLVSNCQSDYLNLFFELSELKEYFVDYDCAEMSGLPKGEMLKIMKKKHNLQNPVYIGDTEGDKKASKYAEMAFFLVQNGFGK